MIAAGAASLFSRALNHVLRQQPWAAQRLAAHAGRTVELRAPAPAPALRLGISPDGELSPADPAAESALVVTLKPGALPKLLSRSDDLLDEVEISGNAELASELQLLFRNLRWDAEEDLSRVVGDVAAHRLMGLARNFSAWQRDAALRLGQNLADYWTEERPLIAHRDDIGRFLRDVDTLRDDLERLARRIERIGG